MLNVNNEILASLGITPWHARMDKHPMFDASDMKLIFEPLLFKPRCLVILFINSLESIVGYQKVLDGMLGVLNLERSEYMLLKVLSVRPKMIDLAAQINACKPEYILQLNMDLPIVVDNINTIRTYSPDYLQQNPAYKPQAYKDLLSLRNLLHHGTS